MLFWGSSFQIRNAGHPTHFVCVLGGACIECPEELWDNRRRSSLEVCGPFPLPKKCRQCVATRFFPSRLLFTNLEGGLRL